MYLIGDIVKINNSSLTGRIVSIEKNEKCIVCINEKNITTDISNILKVDINNDKYTKANNISTNSVTINFSNNLENNSSLAFIPEIMVRHQTVEEALFNVDMFLEEALYRKIQTVKIIHGKHGGILRGAVHKYLKENKNVKAFRLGNYFEGSYGVTIVTLKIEL